MNHNDAIACIAKREPFKASNFVGYVQTYFTGLGGRPVADTPSLASYGRIDLKEYNVLRCYQNAAEVDYVVLSYRTPIAYHTKSDGWIVLSKKHSVTTSKHTNYVKRAIALEG